jgi:bifunctional DNA-binding transcriptional regulator/antitoxin component of YhaV-PrlF toxin-antitoxin module
MVKFSCISIPKPIRDGIILNPGYKITIVVENDKICVKKTSSNKITLPHFEIVINHISG